MDPARGATSSKFTSAFWTIATAGLIAGSLDITSAFALAATKGVTAGRVLQFVASGLLGPQSFEGGLATAALGLVLHFVIAFGAAAVFYAASRKLSLLTQHAAASGIAFGVAVYASMNLIVLPLSAAKARYSTSGIVTQLIIHMLLVGLPISLIVCRLSRPKASPKNETS